MTVKEARETRRRVLPLVSFHGALRAEVGEEEVRVFERSVLAGQEIAPSGPLPPLNSRHV
jgi:hypothetical protein